MSILTDLEKWGVKVTVLLYALGFIIHNLYLMNYGYMEFDLLQTRYIYTGIAALLYFVSIYLFAMLRVNFEDPKKHFTLITFFTWAFRFPFLCVLLTAIFFPGNKFFENYLIEYMGNRIGSIIWVSTVILGGLYLSGLTWVTLGFIPKYYILRIFKYIFAISSIPFLILVTLVIWSNNDIGYIFWFALFPFYPIVGYLRGRVAGREGEVLKLTPIPTLNEQYSKKYEKIFLASLFVFSLVVTSYIYSNRLYQKISMNLGGARPVAASLVVGLDTLKVKIINENSSWFLVETSDSSKVQRIRADIVKKVIYQK